MKKDIRKPLFDILSDKSKTDVLLVNVPSRWYKQKSGLFDLPFKHLNFASQNSERLYGDQDHEPNHGLLMVCSQLKNKGVNFKLLDLHTLCFLMDQGVTKIDIEDLLKEFIIVSKPQIVGFSSMSPNLPIAQALINISKHINPNIITVIGGLATIELDKCFENGTLDFAVLSEGEHAFSELVEKLLNAKHEEIEGIPNLALLKNGVVVQTAKKKLGVQPKLVPAYELLPEELELIPRLFTSRGCGNKCDFCSPAIFFDNQLSMRDASDVIEDIAYLHDNFEFDWFNLGDLTFYISSRSVKEICEFLAIGKYKKWWCQTQASQLTNENIELLGKAGCCQVAIGFEDFSVGGDRIRAKNPGKAKAIEVCKSLHNSGVMVQGYWIFGTPEDTFSSSLNKISDICEFVRNGYVDTVHISYLIPYNNTAYAHNGTININHMNYSDFIDLSYSFYNAIPMHSTNNLTTNEVFLLTQLAISTCANEFYAKSSAIGTLKAMKMNKGYNTPQKSVHWIREKTGAKL